MIGAIAQEWLQQGEQRGEQRRLRRGLLDGIELGLELRFGLDGLRLLPEIAQIEDAGVLKAVHEAIRSVTRPEELRQFYTPGERRRKPCLERSRRMDVSRAWERFGVEAKTSFENGLRADD